MDRISDQDRHDEIRQELARDLELARDRRRFREPAKDSCPKDGRVLGTGKA